MNLKLWMRRQFRRKSRVYIMPTKMGGYLVGLIFLMFLLAIGYSNNLLLIFTLFLFAFNMLWLVQSHFHLHRLKLDQVLVDSGHALEPLQVRVVWQKSPRGPLEWELELETLDESHPLSAFEHNQQSSKAEFILKKRGEYDWRYLRVSSVRPFGLYRVWIFFPIEHKSLIYPPLLPTANISPRGLDLEGELSVEKIGPDDFHGLSPYQADEPRKISWKHYARTGELLIREGEERKAAVVEFNLRLPANPEMKEAYLSKIATQMVECYRRDIPFSMQYEILNKRPSVQRSNLYECLEVLARC